MHGARTDLARWVGAPHVLGGADCHRYEHDERGLFHGRALAVVRPGTTVELAHVVTYCAQHDIAMVPQGGHTGYCGGATPDASGTQIVISLERLNRILALDPVAHTITVEAGATLAAAQAAAVSAARLFPLAMASQASCQIGGNLSTNAGGLAVLRYGTARDLALGLRVVLADGQVFDKLSTLRKDTSGYDLKQLFIGAEGTLGIISAVTLKLFPLQPRTSAWVSVDSVTAASALLSDLRRSTNDALTSFEYIGETALALLAEPPLGLRPPLGGAHQLLVECAGDDAPALLEQVLGAALEAGAVADVVIAHNETQRAHMWRTRESIPAAEKLAGGSVKHDIAVPVSAVPAFIEAANALLGDAWPGVRACVYGHLGDGNVHLNVLAPSNVAPTEFLGTQAAAISAAVHRLACEMSGSFSAEHGVGVLKRDALNVHASPVACALMREVKQALDPRGLMNPGKLVPALAP